MSRIPVFPMHEFRLIKLMEKGAYAEEKRKYRIHVERALLAVLVCVVVLFLVFRRMPERNRRIRFVPGFATMNLDLVQATNRGGMPRPPDLPQVPIPVEDEYLPDDETIDIFDFDVNEGIPLFDGFGTVPDAGGMGLRPIREVIPEYPKDLRRRGIEGVVLLSILVNSRGHVDSVEVLKNTSLSRRLEQAAVQAAYGSRYVPAKRDGEKIACWIQRRYEFGGR